MHCLKYACSLFNNAHIFTNIREQMYLMQSTRYIPEINPRFHIKQTKYLCRHLKNAICWQYKMRSSRSPDVSPGQSHSFRQNCWTNFAFCHIFFSFTYHSLSLYVSSYEGHIWRQVSRSIKMWVKTLAFS
jgi:hypothetical protein